MQPIDYVDEDLFPKSVRIAVNSLIYREARPWLITYEYVPEGKVLFSEDRVNIILPKRGGAKTGSGSDSIRGFDWYAAPYLGTGTPPASQSRQIQFRAGVINGSIIPDNMASVFEIPNNTTSYARCTTRQNTQGTVTSASLDIATTLVPDPDGSLDVAPATSARPLWQFVVVNNAIQTAIELRTSGIDVLPVAYNVQCGEVQVRMLWTPAQNPLPS